MKLYNACVIPVFMYGLETWQLTEKQEKKLDVFDQRCLRRVLKVRWQQHVTNETIKERARQEALSVKVGRARLRWFGHINRMNNNRIAKQTTEWRPREGKRRTGRQRMSWKTTVERDLQKVISTWVEARRQAQNRKGWKELCARLGKS